MIYLTFLHIHSTKFFYLDMKHVLSLISTGYPDYFDGEGKSPSAGAMAKCGASVFTLVRRRETGKPVSEKEMRQLCLEMSERARRSSAPPYPEERKRFKTWSDVSNGLMCVTLARVDALMNLKKTDLPKAKQYDGLPMFI